jgi:hypothetical protein
MGYQGASIAIDNAFREARPFDETTGGSRSKEPVGTQRREPFGESLLKAETEELLDHLDDVARRLFRYPSQKVLEDYRSVVGRIIEGAESMLALRRDYSVASPKARTLIERAEKGLDELERILRREGRRSRIMGITSEIKGCLLSLLV